MKLVLMRGGERKVGIWYGWQMAGLQIQGAYEQLAKKNVPCRGGKKVRKEWEKLKA